MKRFSTILVALLCTVSTIFADLPFRNHRYDAFKVLPVNSEQIVFIGNSITNMNAPPKITITGLITAHTMLVDSVVLFIGLALIDIIIYLLYTYVNTFR